MHKVELEPFFRHLGRVRRFFFFGAVVCLPFALLLLFIPTKKNDAGEMIAMVAITIFFLLMGGASLGMALRPFTKDKAVRILLDRPADIVWIYPVRVMNAGNHVLTRYSLKTIDGKSVDLGAVPADERAAEDTLRRACPAARFGYTREWEDAFKQNPMSLRQARQH